MKVEPTPQPSFWDHLTRRSTWIGPLWGLVSGLIVIAIAKAVGFPYHREAGVAAFFMVPSVIGSHQNGLLKLRPVIALGMAIAMGAFGAALMHWVE